ncbi:MAG: putative General secretion pathway protein GspG [Microgenomates group bacterium Gr01-1014_7]|nr:MAG: putative General secretion pathway protein GspG [Microgenomates group bacterium Gr01-1014_7]
MKKLLPNKRGFTLVELLVVVSIIAVLSAIGLAIFGNTQKAARDARRRDDINSIAQAMEINYGKTTGGQYDPLAAAMFSSGTVPRDPISTSATPDSACPGVCQYCVRQGSGTQAGAVCTQAVTDIAAPNMPLGGASNPNWIVCANLEAPKVGDPTFYCRKNQQ